jgi:hypothetical protein
MLSQFKVLHYLFSVNARKKIIAHCLNFDFVTSGDTLEEAERRLDTLVKFHIETFIKSNGLSGLGASAPKKFWAEYVACLRQGGKFVLPSSTLRINVPEIVPMEKPYGELEIVAAKAA